MHLSTQRRLLATGVATGLTSLERRALGDENVAASRDVQDNAKNFSVTERYRYYVAWLLCVVYLFNQVDRQIFAILQQSIKLEFHFSDGQLGLIGGTAFGLFYATLAIPIARFADHGNRVNTVTISLALWSLFTAVTGLAKTFSQLLFARLIVGVGEAGCSPAAYSIISDYFEPKRRASAIAIYSLGVSGGSIIGLLVGSKVAELYGWQAAFYLMGLPGVVLAVVVKLTLREPPRGLSDATPSIPAPPVLQVMKTLWAKQSFRNLSIAATIYSIAANGIGAFYSVFLIRSHHLGLAQTGRWLALASIGGLAGYYLGGKLSDLFANRRQDARWLMWLPAIAMLVNLPLGLLLFTATNKFAVMSLLTLNITLSGVYLAPTVASTQRLVHAQERALASAVLFFLMGLIGLGLGPALTGYLSDLFGNYFLSNGMSASQASADGLRFAFMCLLTAPLLASVFYMRAARSLRRDLIA